VTVLISGSSNGIGRACAAKFLSAGYNVIGLDRRAPDGLVGDNFRWIECDLSDSDSLPSLGDIDIVVSSAGVSEDRGFDAIPNNLLGCINFCERYADTPSIRAAVIIASISGHNGMTPPYYSVAQGGLLSYTKNLAQRLSRYGAVVNSVSPGGVITRMNSRILDDAKLYDRALRETLLNKWATAEEVADLVYFLTAVNKSITGQDIIIDNGECAKFNFV